MDAPRYGPPDASLAPRYTGIRTYARCPHTTDWANADVAVIGVPDLHRGETVKAYVRLRDGQAVTAGDLRAFLKDRLAPFQMPRQIEFLDALPKTLIGKISKKDLSTAETGAQPELDSAWTPGV